MLWLQLYLYLYSFIETYHETIWQLFQFDLQILTLIPYFYNEKDVNLLCNVLPVELAIIWLIERLQLSLNNDDKVYISN